jgi:hypothetical protein
MQRAVFHGIHKHGVSGARQAQWEEHRAMEDELLALRARARVAMPDLV